MTESSPASDPAQHRTTVVSPDKKRLFVAIVPSLDIARKVSQAVDTMRKRGQEVGVRVSWVPPANLHVTLKFLGWTSVELVGAVEDQLRARVAQTQGFELCVRGVGSFPEDRPARILWAGLEPTPALTELAEGLDAGLGELGVKREGRPYHPHITMGRARSGGDARDLIAPFVNVSFGRFLAREVVLYESVIKSRGSEYTPLVRIPFDVPPYQVERQSDEVQEGSTKEHKQNGGDP